MTRAGLCPCVQSPEGEVELEENSDTCQGSTACLTPAATEYDYGGTLKEKMKQPRAQRGNTRIRNLETTHSMESKEGYPVRQE